MLQVLFPTGCKSVTRELDEDELEKRLKVLSNKLTHWSTSNAGIYGIYKSLAYHLAKPFFLSHANTKIQLYIASCLSDIFRAFAPSSPYSQDPGILPKVLLFLSHQLKLLEDCSSPFYTNSQYILTSLTRAKAFSLCSDLPETPSAPKITQSLLTILVRIINTNCDKDINGITLHLISDLLKSSEKVLGQSLPIIFLSLIDAQDNNKNARDLSRKILTDSKEILRPYLAEHFLKILTNPGNEDLYLEINSIILAISSIFPKIFEAILPQLKTLINSPDHEERHKAVIICSKLLSDERFNLLQTNKNYLRLFLIAFGDENEMIRITCITEAKPFLLNTSTQDYITSLLKLLQHDPSSEVRLKIISTIISSAKENFNILSAEGDLFNIIRKGCVDPDLRIRRYTLKCLGNFYRERSENYEDYGDSRDTKSMMTSILNEILCGYYIKNEEDRIWIEKIVIVWLLRFRDGVEGRIKRLYLSFVQSNDNACMGFAELHIHRFTIRQCLLKLFELKQQLKNESNLDKISELEKASQKQLKLVSKFFPDRHEAEGGLQKFFEDIHENTLLLEEMKTFLQPQITCQQSENVSNDILSKIGDLNETDPYYRTIKVLLERSSSILIDEKAARFLIKYLQDVVKGDEMRSIIGLDPKIAEEKGFKFLEVLSYVFAPHFTHPDIFVVLVDFLKNKNKLICIKVLNVLSNIGKFRHLDQICSTTYSDLEVTCKILITSGNTKEAKAAVKLIAGLSSDKAVKIFKELLERIKQQLSDQSPQHAETLIASLGYISVFGWNLTREINELVKFVYKKVLRPDTADCGDNAMEKTWCEKEELPKRIIYSLEAMKCVTRWLISREPHESWITEILRVLTAFVSRNGNIDRAKNLRANVKSWLRLQAGCCLLKLCKFERIANQMTPKQFYTLSTLMLDDVDEVRKRFYDKLIRGLSGKCPRECLPIDFIGFYALGGLEINEELREDLKTKMMMHFRKRNENAKKLMELEGFGAEGKRLLQNIRPECGVIYAVMILAHWEGFLESEGDEALREVKRGLEFVLKNLFDGDDGDVEEQYRFFKQLMQNMRACRDAETPQDDRINSKIQTLCDIATCFLENEVKKGRMGFGEGDQEILEPSIPTRYLQYDEELVGESEDNTSMEILAERLKNLEVMEEKKRVDQKMDLGSFLKQILGPTKRTKRTANKSSMQESSGKRRKRSIRGN